MPPRLAERVMRWSLAPDERAAVLGDLEEEFAHLAAMTSVTAAERWYWRQALTSAVPNLTRRIRRAYLEEFGTPEARAAQRQHRNSALWFMAFGVAAPVVLHLLSRKTWRGPEDWFIAELGLIFLLFSYFETGLRRRRKPGEGIVAFAGLVLWAWLLIVHDSRSSVLWLLVSAQVLSTWPPRLWPIPELRQARRYSVATPIVTWRQPDGKLYGTTTLPADPMAMDRPTLGFAAPAKIAPEDLLEGIVPLMPILQRSFRPEESIRLFAVLNANPDVATATLEVRDEASGQVVRRVPVEVTTATPKLPPPPPPWAEDGGTRLPKWPVSALDVVLPLAGLAPGKYDLRLVATEGTMTSSECEAIEVLPAAPSPQPAA